MAWILHSNAHSCQYFRNFLFHLWPLYSLLQQILRTNLKDTCFYARLTQSLDNEATVLFSVLMAFWSVLFLEFWKRYAFELRCRWDVSGKIQEEEYPRPDYLARLRGVKKQELNVVTRTVEPVLSFWKKKFPNTLFSISMVLLLSSLAVSAVVAVILYRISITVVIFTQWAEYDPRVHSWGLILVHGTAVLINLLFIHFFDWLYTFLAEYLTTIELHRTQSEYDESLTLKIFLLKFINFYSSLFYIAFFKGKFVGTPQKYKYFFGYRNEECGGSGGCMTELSIQLVSVMIVKQGLNAVLEMVAPFLKRFWKEKRHHRKDKKITSINTQWERDYNLLDWSSRTLVPEYLEMVIQFGFITIFVSAFPLAPLFALLNNIFEMRLDAQKLLKYYRRPISSHVSNIGVWFPILDSLVKLSVISNSFIIAFTSNFIPKFVYRAERGTLDGFLSYVSHRFNISDFPIESAPITTYGNISVCIYQSFEDIPHDKGQGYINFYWKVLMARLAFIVVFQNVVFCCSLLLNWLIPDVPRKLKIKIRQRDHIIKEYNIKQEREKSIQPTTTHCSNTLMTIDDECCWLESIL